jgi:hypothetical protein
MSAEVKKEIEPEIAHILFIDIVAYSKRSINEQHATIEELSGIVRSSEQFRKAEAASRLLKIPTWDGMALLFSAPRRSALRANRRFACPKRCEALIHNSKSKKLLHGVIHQQPGNDRGRVAT